MQHSLKRTINGYIAYLDLKIHEQLNQILHDPLFQEMEARWRGVHYLIESAEEDSEHTHIRILDITWKEIHRDLTRTMEFDQSELFAKIYSDEFGTPGGTPYGLLIGDYTVHITGPQSTFDLTVLSGLASICAASFCPFVAATGPDTFGVESFETPFSFSNLEKFFKQTAYSRWQQFRKNPDTRFIGLTLPRVIFRKPYSAFRFKNADFFFQEEITHQVDHYLWGNGAFAFGMAVVGSFAVTGWPSSIRGIRDPEQPSGIVHGLPRIQNHNDLSQEKFSTELMIDSQDESEIAEAGFIPICQYGEEGNPIFYSNSSVFNPKQSPNDRENINMKLSSMLQYILAASRFAHYLKIMGRDWVGSLSYAQEIEQKLNNWIRNFVASNEVNKDYRIRYPLQDAKVKVSDSPDKIGFYQCIIYLRPRLQLEKVDTSLQLATDIFQVTEGE